MRNHIASHLTDAELDHARRELTASLALSRPGSAIRAPIQAQLTAIDAELAGRTNGAAGRTSHGMSGQAPGWPT
jgi:hypothetical protein